jgi:hypothetical protein
MTPGEILNLHEAAQRFVQIVQDGSTVERSIELAQRVNRVMTGEKRADAWLTLAALVAGMMTPLADGEKRVATAGFALLVHEMGSL